MKRKILTFIIFIFVANNILSMTINGGAKANGLYDLEEKGIIYVRTNDSNFDEAIIASMESTCKYDFKVKEKGTALEKGDISIVRGFYNVHNNVTLESIEAPVLYLYQSNSIDKRFGQQRDLEHFISLVYLDGFTQKLSGENSEDYSMLEYCLNGMFELIKECDNSMKGIPARAKLSKKLESKINPEENVLNGKTLLILEGNKHQLSEDILKNHGVSYQFMSLKDFKMLEENEKSKYCLFYYGYGPWPVMAVIDLEAENLAYYNYDPSRMKKLARETKEIAK